MESPGCARDHFFPIIFLIETQLGFEDYPMLVVRPCNGSRHLESLVF